LADDGASGVTTLAQADLRYSAQDFTVLDALTAELRHSVSARLG
jgi:hypothetical protein